MTSRRTQLAKSRIKRLTGSYRTQETIGSLQRSTDKQIAELHKKIDKVGDDLLKLVVTFEKELPAGSSFQYTWLQDKRLGVSDLAAPYTKWDYFVHTNLNVDKIIGRAFQLAHVNPMGPTLVTMSKETAAEKMTSVTIPKVIPEYSPSAPSGDTLSKVSNLLISRRRSRSTCRGSTDAIGYWTV